MARAKASDESWGPCGCGAAGLVLCEACGGAMCRKKSCQSRHASCATSDDDVESSYELAQLRRALRSF